MDIGKRIREKREKLNLKQTDLAHALMVSPQAVSKWERGETCPDISYLVSLAAILNVSTDYLLGANELENGIFEASVFCSSISEFAKKSMIMKSKEVADWANVIFHHLTEAVLKWDAVPIKYLGDGFLCFFSGHDHAERALEAAVYAKRTIQSKPLKISINSGPIYLGTIGHPDYCSRDICGETVNMAFLSLEHVEKKCKTGIGLSENTVRLIRDKSELKEHSDNHIGLMDIDIKLFEPMSVY